MPTELLPAIERTQGSHAVLNSGLLLMARLRAAPQTPLIVIVRPLADRGEVIPEPVRSAGGSQPSQHLDDYLRIALASFSALVSESPREIRMTASPKARAAQMDPWAAKNGRRIRLIEKKHGEGLTAKEDAELVRLKREVSEHMQIIAPRSTEVLDEIASRIEALKKRVAAKKGNKA